MANKYLDSKTFKQQILQYKQTKVVSEELGMSFIKLAEHLLLHKSFRQYPEALKEDLKGYAFERLILALDKVNVEKNVFSYMTTVAYNAYLYMLKKHYKYENLKNRMYQQNKEKFFTEVTTIEK